MKLVCLPLLHLCGVLCQAAELKTWTAFPPLPDAEGFAGAFAGTTDGVLLVAGGTNFPDRKPWEGGSKAWYDSVYALERRDDHWQRIGKLPAPNGYGVSISTADGMICIGGGNAEEHFRDVFRIRRTRDGLRLELLPPLPGPCAFMAGVENGAIIYVAGGIGTPEATEALHVFWALDLRAPNAGWQTLPAWPGPERMLACMAAADDSIYLFSGARLKAGADGKPVREWLRDAYRYTPGASWMKIADLPRAAVAAPSPVPLVGDGLMILGGDDGALVDFEPKQRHPGFPRDILLYDVRQNTWKQAGNVPFSLVTTPAVVWQNHLVVPGGEARPGKRSPAVWGLPLNE